MKSFWKLLCSLCVCVTLAACGNKIDESALTAFEDAAAKMGEWNSFGYELVINEEDQITKGHGEVIKSKENASFPNMSLIAEITYISIPDKRIIEWYFYENTMYLNTIHSVGKEEAAYPQKITLPQMKIAEDNKIHTLGNIDTWKSYLKSASKDGDVIRLEFDTEELLKIEEIKEFSESHDLRLFTIEINLAEDGSVHSFVYHTEEEDKKAGSSETIITDIDFQFKDVNKIDSLTLPDLSDYEDTGSPILIL